MRKLLSILFCLVIVLFISYAGVQANAQESDIKTVQKAEEAKIEEQKVDAVPIVSPTEPGVMRRPPAAFKRDTVKFISVEKGDKPGINVMTVQNEKGEKVKIEVPEYVSVRKTIKVKDLKGDEEITVNYRVMDDKNTAISIRAGEMYRYTGPVPTRPDMKMPARPVRPTTIPMKPAPMTTPGEKMTTGTQVKPAAESVETKTETEEQQSWWGRMRSKFGK